MSKEIQGYIINFSKKIREGRYGSIFECKRKNSQQIFFAQKIIVRNELETQFNKNILTQIKNNSDTNLLQIYDVLPDEKSYIIISESYEQTLEEYLNQQSANPLEESEIENILQQLVKGYLHLSSLKIIYGGIEFQNIVLKRDNQKIIYKIAPSKNSVLFHEKPQKQGLRMSGLYFRAPELLNPQGQNQISEESDIYSLGLLILQICFPTKMSQMIYSVSQLKKFQNDLKEQKFSWPDPSLYQEEFQQKVLSMIAYDPQKRCKWITLQNQKISQTNKSEQKQNYQELVKPSNAQNFDQRSPEDIPIFKSVDKGLDLVYSKFKEQNQLNQQSQNQPYDQNYNQMLDNQEINKIKLASQAQQIHGETQQNITAGNHSVTTIIDYCDDDFEVFKNVEIGKGNQGAVYKAKILKTQEEIVAKQVSGGKKEIIREIDIFQLLKYKKHENLVRFYHKGTDKYKDYIFLEKCDESLSLYMRKLVDDLDIIEFIKQITMGYLFLIQEKIIHRDLKPDNIMVKHVNLKPVYKLIDFGVGKELSEDKVTQTYAGTPMYQAPEVFNKQLHNHQCDVFSVKKSCYQKFGMIIYEIVFKGNYLKDKKTKQDVKDFHDEIKQNKFKCPHYKNQNLTDLIEKMIVYDFNQRIKWKEILYHQIFNSQN